MPIYRAKESKKKETTSTKVHHKTGHQHLVGEWQEENKKNPGLRRKETGSARASVHNDLQE
jgi:hypothetical protein